MPKPWAWLSGLVVSLTVVALLFAANAGYSRKESVRGWLVSRDGVARISHGATGTVERIAAQAGVIVSAGDPILYLSRDRALELGKQVASLERRIQLLRDEAEIEQQSIAARLRVLDDERRAIARQRKEQQHRIEVSAEKLLRLKSAAEKGAATAWDVMRQEDEQASLRRSGDELQQSDIALQRDVEQLTAKAKRLPVETERSEATLRSEQSRLQQQATELESSRRIVLKSPISGKLASVEVHPGGAVTPRQLLATVLPENMTLVAEVYVPSSAIGFIRPGQRVRLMYDAFPQQQFGAFAGEVESISDFVLLPSEVPQTFFPGEATFKVRIAPLEDAVDLEAGRAVLRPGMLLGAEIILEKRTFVEWLLQPLRLRRKDAA